MRKEQRLRRRKDFAAAYRKGHTQSNHLLVVRVLPNDKDVTRFGFVTGKAVGNAVIRNRTKRRLRAAADSISTESGRDIVIGARKPAAEADYAALQRALRTLLRRAQVPFTPREPNTNTNGPIAALPKAQTGSAT